MLWFKWVSYDSAVSPWIEIFTQECIKCCADGGGKYLNHGLLN